MAREDVNECHRTLAAGDYDGRRFAEAIVAIYRVADLDCRLIRIGTIRWMT
jgi:hypothetical protein